MPNWVYNSVTITGKEEAIAGLRNWLEGDRGLEEPKYHLSSFDKDAYPQTFLDYDTTSHPNGMNLPEGTPAEVIEQYKAAAEYQEKTYGVVGWYDFNIMHYGCKWDSSVYDLKFLSDGITFDVKTPWSLPLKWAQRLAKDWGVRVDIDFLEEAMQFGPGIVTFEPDGTVSEVLKRYYIVADEMFMEDDREYAISALEDATGLDIDPDITDEQLMQPQFVSKVDEIIRAKNECITISWEVRNLEQQ